MLWVADSPQQDVLVSHCALNGVSSNGRTAAFGAVNGGSIPSSPARSVFWKEARLQILLRVFDSLTDRIDGESGAMTSAFAARGLRTSWCRLKLSQLFNEEMMKKCITPLRFAIYHYNYIRLL